MKKIDYEITERGWLYIQGIHDAEIYSISYEYVGKFQNLLVQMRSEAGEKIVLKCINSGSVKIDNFNHQNVVSEIEIYNLRSALEVLKEFKKHPYCSSDETIQSMDDEIVAGKTILLNICPSYGCEAIIVCDGVEVFKE